MIRIFLLILTNLLIVLFLGLFLKLLGLQNNINQISIFFMILFGLIGSITSLIFSKWITLNSINGKIIKYPKNKNEEFILNIIKKISIKKNIKIPQLIIYNSKDLNAFATGATRNNSLIGLSSGLLENMKPNELKAVIAHEISHISSGDMVTMSLLQGVINTFVLFSSQIISQIISNLIYNEKDYDNQKNYNLQRIQSIIFTIFEIMFGFLSNIIIMWFSRYREYSADYNAAKIVGKENMINALIRLKFSKMTNNNKNMSTFYINNNNLNSIKELFNSHPTIEKRIKKLKKIKN